MTTKTQLLKQLDDEFVSPHGAYSEIPGYDTGNPHLYNAYYCYMLSDTGNLTETHKTRFATYIKKTEITPGLHSRFPKEVTTHNPASHDERMGLMILSQFLPSIGNKLLREMLEYGKRNHFSFNSNEPFADFWFAFKSHPIDLITKATKYFYDLATGKDKEFLDAEYPAEVVALRYTMRHSDRYVLKKLQNVKPSMVDTFVFLFRSLLTAVQADTTYGRGTSMLLLMFRWKLISPFNGSIMRRLNLLVIKRLKDKYGINYDLHLLQMHFGELNPIIQLVKIERGIKQ